MIFRFTSMKATMMAPNMTQKELRAAQRRREMDSPPASVNFTISVKGSESRKLKAGSNQQHINRVKKKQKNTKNMQKSFQFH